MSHYFKEKILFAAASFASSCFAGLGAIMTDGETRWIYVTMSIAILCSAFLALSFRRSEESIRVVVGRCGMSCLLTVFGTRILVEAANLKVAHTDVLYLGGLSLAVCVASYTVGHGLFRSLDENSTGMGNWIRKFLMKMLSK